jgi:hypothetical protein
MPPRPPLPRPYRIAFGVVMATLFFGGAVYLVRDPLQIVLDPAFSEVTADDLIAGVPITHPRIRITGACIDGDSQVVSRWTTQNKQGKRSNHYQTAALLRRASDGAPTGWLVSGLVTTAKGCAAKTLEARRVEFDDGTWALAQEAGLSPVAGQLLGPGVLPVGSALVRVLLALWMGGSAAAFHLLLGFDHPNASRAARRASRIALASLALSAVGLVLFFLGTSCGD